MTEEGNGKQAAMLIKPFGPGDHSITLNFKVGLAGDLVAVNQDGTQLNMKLSSAVPNAMIVQLLMSTLTTVLAIEMEQHHQVVARLAEVQGGAHDRKA